MLQQLSKTRLAYAETAQATCVAMLALKRSIDVNKPFDFRSALNNGRMLFLGEGNLSFAYLIARRLGDRASRVVATTFEDAGHYDDETRANAGKLRSLGAKVRDNVDAGRCDTTFLLGSIDLAVFQFPNVGSRTPLYRRNPNHILMRRFLSSIRNVLSEKGRIAVTVVNSSHYDGAFGMDEVAEKFGFEKPVAHPFFLKDYPGYTHTKTKDDGKPAIDGDDDFVTFVFQVKSARL